MFWDGFILLVAIGLGVAGWNVGLINSWRSPICMIVATVVTQQFYVDFSTWIVQQLMVKADFGAFLGYLMMWLVIEIVLEIMLNIIITWGKKDQPMLFDRIGGVVLSLIKWVMIILFPIMAMEAPGKIPSPPEKTDGLINPFAIGFEDSNIVKTTGKIAKDMLPGLGRMIVSDKEPSFKANFDKPPVLKGDIPEEKKEKK